MAKWLCPRSLLEVSFRETLRSSSPELVSHHPRRDLGASAAPLSPLSQPPTSVHLSHPHRFIDIHKPHRLSARSTSPPLLPVAPPSHRSPMCSHA
ncbi:hypothetical protein HYPSUDRAFT_72235 [Hypholoma sublateritium FD-334 SS-4]|uniref:Uncharacterized protein n=1 Tax=Hypholoma sublateritium (strain FD-334 SS-4) TaxID=945553 RepID=A0A0D2NEP0_HYPSF|nr:hypothetical protein HYPSUDRAFT_72235 [Hypholoma sublateritium FD-334 SS-4]